MEQILITQITKEELFEGIRSIVNEENKRIADIKSDELLSQTEARKLFTPPIAPQTFKHYFKQGRFAKIPFGKRDKYSKIEILEAAQSIKKYARTEHSWKNEK